MVQGCPLDTFQPKALRILRWRTSTDFVPPRLHSCCRYSVAKLPWSVASNVHASITDLCHPLRTFAHGSGVRHCIGRVTFPKRSLGLRRISKPDAGRAIFAASEDLAREAGLAGSHQARVKQDKQDIMRFNNRWLRNESRRLKRCLIGAVWLWCRRSHFQNAHKMR